MPDRQTIRQLTDDLVQRKKELLARLEMNEEDWAGLHEKQIEFEEQAANAKHALRFEGLDEQILQELGRIEKALRKIDNDVYGYCESCGEKISTERLQAVPAAETCKSCAAGKVPETTGTSDTPAPAPSGPVAADLAGLDDERQAAGATR